MSGHDVPDPITSTCNKPQTALIEKDAVMTEQYVPTPEDDALEATIGRLFDRLEEVREGSAEYKMLVRQLHGLREGSEIAGLIFEEFGINGYIIPD